MCRRPSSTCSTKGRAIAHVAEVLSAPRVVPRPLAEQLCLASSSWPSMDLWSQVPPWFEDSPKSRFQSEFFQASARTSETLATRLLSTRSARAAVSRVFGTLQGSVNASAPAPWLQHQSGPITGKDFWKKHPVPALADGKKPSAASRGA